MSRRRPGENVKGEDPSRAGRFSYEGLNRIMHEKARLGILASLAASSGELLFNDLKRLCSLTDGNLSRHLAVLCDAGLVEVRKSASHGRQQTKYRLTARGRRRFAEYINVLESIVADAQRELHASPDGAASWSPA